MNDSIVREAIVDQLGARGYRLAVDEHETDLISAGVNSVNLVRVMSALEETFDIEFEAAGFFDESVTVARLAAEIIRRIA
ncbi:phosphopantetheine-binding protein [Nocardia sp. NPDC051463]|uniref:acyl carrier protein n=1 Tax=Nocardia sp. NPDC051463 TaxID=3154845 RepID=UPI0034301DD5